MIDPVVVTVSMSPRLSRVNFVKPKHKHTTIVAIENIVGISDLPFQRWTYC